MLEIKNLHLKYFNSQEPSIKDVSFSIEKGSRTAIIGPSGCGKTTILNVIAGLLTEKEIEMEGGIIWKFGKAKPVVRYVFQQANLLPWKNVEENISFGLEVEGVRVEEIKKRVAEIIGIVGLEKAVKKYPRQLSVGMQQRVNFARALVCEPDMILLDEPFAALDIEMKKKLQNEFIAIIQKKVITSLFVTHDISEALTMANKIIVLSKGPSVVQSEFSNHEVLENFKNLDYLEIYED